MKPFFWPLVYWSFFHAASVHTALFCTSRKVTVLESVRTPRDRNVAAKELAIANSLKSATL
jgi:hypothetical protein